MSCYFILYLRNFCNKFMYILLFRITIIVWFIRLSVQTFQPLILRYRRSNCVFVIIADVHKWPLSYPFRSLVLTRKCGYDISNCHASDMFDLMTFSHLWIPCTVQSWGADAKTLYLWINYYMDVALDFHVPQ